MDARRIPLDVQLQAAGADAVRRGGAPSGATLNGDGGRGNGHIVVTNEPTRTRSELVVPRGPELSIERFTRVPASADLGRGDLRFDIKTDMGPFHVLPDYKTDYPGQVTRGLGNLFAEYNLQFAPLVEQNREWDTDYQYAMSGPGGTPVNLAVQIDMLGLPQGYLDAAAGADDRTVQDGLRRGIFEIENSLAMYQLLGNLFPRENGRPSQFKEGLGSALDEVRERTGKPIALLAVTEEKAAAMRASEFGKQPDEPLTNQEVRDLTGFDAFFGPREFAEMVQANGGESPYLLYARTSEPVAKLKKPGLQVDNPLLADDDMRRVIKANAITFNVDNPAWAPNDPRRINDTKEYLEPMGMGLAVASPDELFVIQPGAKKGEQPTTVIGDTLAEYLIAQGIDPLKVASGDVAVHAKPMKGAYGCYGHASGTIRDKDFRTGVRKGMKDRGLYVVQPRMETPTLTDSATGTDYMYIDRNFMAIVGGEPVFIGGYRSMMPQNTTEAKAGRVHGNGETRWAEVRPAAA